MPILLPAPQSGSLTSLANVLLGGASDYEQQTRATADEERRRAQQLSDVQSQRDFAVTEANRERANRLTDEQAATKRQIALALVNEKLLDPAKINDDAAVAEAFKKAQDLGLETTYQAMINAGLLNVADLHDPVKVAAAKQQLATRNATLLNQKTEQDRANVVNAQASADVVQRQYNETIANMQDLQGELDKPVEELLKPPTPQQIQNAAIAIARQNVKPGTQPGVADIQAAVPEATQQINQTNLQGIVLRKQQIADRIKSLHDTSTSLASRLNALEQRGISPSAKVLSEPSIPAPVTAKPPSITNPDAARRAAMQSIVDQVQGGPAGGAPAPGPAAAVAPTADQVFGQLDNMGIFQRPVTQQGKFRLMDPVTPEMISAARQSIVGEISRLNQTPATRATPGRLQSLQDALGQLDALSRSADQSATAKARLQGGPPVSDALATVPGGTFGSPVVAPTPAGVSPFGSANPDWWKSSAMVPALQ